MMPWVLLLVLSISADPANAQAHTADVPQCAGDASECAEKDIEEISMKMLQQKVRMPSQGSTKTNETAEDLTDFSNLVDCMHTWSGRACDGCKDNLIKKFGPIWNGDKVSEAAFGGKGCKSKWHTGDTVCGVCYMEACIAGPSYPEKYQCPWEWTFGNNGCATCDSWCPMGSVDNMNYGGRGAGSGKSCQNNDGKTFPCGNEVAGDNGACHQCKCVKKITYDRLR